MKKQNQSFVEIILSDGQVESKAKDILLSVELTLRKAEVENVENLLSEIGDRIKSILRQVNIASLIDKE